MGRPRKFQLTEIVYDQHMNTFVVVDHRLRGFKSEYRVVPINGRHQRYGKAAWQGAHKLTPTGKKSRTGALVTYRANEMSMGGTEERGCDCQCCIHIAYERPDFNYLTGEDRDQDE